MLGLRSLHISAKTGTWASSLVSFHALLYSHASAAYSFFLSVSLGNTLCIICEGINPHAHII